MRHDHPPIIVISGASGSGKGTIIHALTRESPLHWVPTHTTRPVRADDFALSHRIFDTEVNFLRHLARGEFIETDEVAGYRYGLLRTDIENELKANHPVIVELTINGGLRLAEEYPQTVLIFLATEKAERRERLMARQTDREEIEERLRESEREEKIAKNDYDYIVENINHHPEEAIEAIKTIIYEQFPGIKREEKVHP